MLPGKKYTPDDLVRIIVRNKWMILVPFFVITVGTAIVAHFLPNRYRSDTLMLVVPQRVPESYVRSTVTTKIEDRLNSISQQIMSRTRLERIILDNNLYAEERQHMIMQDVVEQMRRDISIDIMKEGEAFRVSYVGKEPRTVMATTERLASLFIEENVNERSQLAESTNQFLQSQLDNARQRLAEQEAKLEAYRQKFSGQLPSQTTSNLQVIQNTQLQIQAVVQALNRDRDRKLVVQSLLQDATAPDSQPTALDPGGQAIPQQSMSARDQLAIAQTRLRAMEGQLTPQHPDIIRARREIAELQKRAEAEALATPLSPEAATPMTPADVARRNRIKGLQLELESLNRQIANGEQQERQLRSVSASYTQRVEMVPARETELAELTRDYTTLQEVYSQLLQKNEESKVAANLERRQIGEQFRLLDPARLPEKPFSPNRMFIDLMGMAAGLAIGLALVGFKEYRDTSFKTEEDVVGLLQLPVLARIPLMVTQSEQVLIRRRRMTVSAIAAVAVLAVGAVIWRLGIVPELIQSAR